MGNARKISHTQRRKLEELPFKNRGFIVLAEHALNILEKLEKNGVLRRKEIMELAGIPKGTIDRALRVLLDLGCIIKSKNGFLRSPDFYVFESKNDRDFALKHSRDIARGLLSMIPKTRDEPEYKGLKAVPAYREDALLHLKTAYPKLYKSLKDAEKADEEASQKERELVEAIRSRLRPKSKKIEKSMRSLVEEIWPQKIIDDIKKVSLGQELRLPKSLKVVGKNVQSDGFELGPKNLLGQFRRFTISEETNETNNDVCRQICDPKKNGSENHALFNKLTKELILQIANRTPVKGVCNHCPKVMTCCGARQNTSCPLKGERRLSKGSARFFQLRKNDSQD